MAKRFRHAFLGVLASLLRGYRCGCIRADEASEDNLGTLENGGNELIDKLFDFEGFVRLSSGYSEFVKAFTGTQMFSSFIKERLCSRFDDFFDTRATRSVISYC